MMNIVSVKNTTEKSKEECEVEIEEADYPYGLCLYLEGDLIKKLGIAPNVSLGTIFNIAGIAKVTSLSEDDYGKRISIQITDLGLEEPSVKKSAANVLYGD